MSDKRPIRTAYYRHKEVVVVTAAKYADNAVCNAVRHMQVNKYNATHCEVFDAVTGKLWAVLHLGVNKLSILYRAPMDEFSREETSHADQQA